jgi:hypothetical protein
MAVKKSDNVYKRRVRRRDWWEDNIKMNLKEIAYVDEGLKGFA